ncbi:reverse transcriptase domain-containing protein [Trichonephila clavipes]|nr:reverse transcriptase domain-containing protein [Trichonephila clavipes]
MSLSITGQSMSHSTLTIKIISGESTLYDHILKEHPTLTCPSGTLCNVSHSTVHHIRTTLGSSVFCRPRRLASEQMKIVKAEFEAMVLEGTARYGEGSWASHSVSYLRSQKNCNILSVIDLVKACTQVPVNEEGIPKTAITTHFGLFEYPFMSFSLRNAGQTFQRFIDGVLNDLDFCFAYIDDLLAISAYSDEHEQHLRILFQRLSDHGLLVNVSKSF